jgi:hypothetical protein
LWFVSSDQPVSGEKKGYKEEQATNYEEEGHDRVVLLDVCCCCWMPSIKIKIKSTKQQQQQQQLLCLLVLQKKSLVWFGKNKIYFEFQKKYGLIKLNLKLNLMIQMKMGFNEETKKLYFNDLQTKGKAMPKDLFTERVETVHGLSSREFSTHFKVLSFSFSTLGWIDFEFNAHRVNHVLVRSRFFGRGNLLT